MTEDPWKAVPTVTSTGPEWAEAPENGWGTLAAWSAGSENCRRQPRDYRSRTVRVTCIAADGTTQERTEPLTTHDIEGIHEDIEAYLTEAGVPLPPRGFTWFIRLPPNIDSGQDFWAAFNREVYARAPEGVYPHQLVDAMAGAMKSLYSGR
jgi:hypothetical protein